jgi:hypothetical protein
MARRRFLTTLGAGLLAGPTVMGASVAPLRSARAETTPSDSLDFTVLRDGTEIGSHTLRFQHDGARTLVDIDINLEVGIGPLVLYRYVHQNREVWEDGKFMRFESRTDDDGDDYAVTATRQDNDILVDRKPAEDYRIDRADLLPTTYWNEATVRQKVLLDTQKGRRMDVAVEDLGWEEITAGGKSVSARKYSVGGDLDLTLWYDESGRWVKLIFPLKGSTFEYVMR